MTSTISFLVRFTVLSQIVWFSACTNLPYYAQAVSGHFAVMHRSQPIQTVIANPEADLKLKHALTKVIALREFASRELKLPENMSYTSYADLERPFVVWNVFAAPQLSTKLKAWCFVQVGCVNYRGFFSLDGAQHYAEILRAEGYDVHVGGVRAYSTLGWFSDPVLNTFIGYPEMDLARLIFHELAHQVVYIPGDTVFNESFATAVEHEGVRRWFEHNGSTTEQEVLRARQQREAVFTQMIFKYRKRLQELYQSERDDSWKRARKGGILAEMRSEFMQLRSVRPEFASYDRWFAQPLNNALLATVSVYTQLLPAFQALLVQQGQDMEQFFAATRQLSKQSKQERNSRLQKLAEDHRQWNIVER